MGSLLVLEGHTILLEEGCTLLLLSVIEDKNGGRMASMVGADGHTVLLVTVDNSCTASWVVENNDNGCTTLVRVKDAHMTLIGVKDGNAIVSLKLLLLLFLVTIAEVWQNHLSC